MNRLTGLKTTPARCRRDSSSIASPAENQFFAIKEVFSIPIQHYETTDIFISAFFLSKGGSLNGIRIKDPARGIAAFEISGHDLDRLDHEYHTGAALVNPVHLRESLNLLRDMLFDLRDRRRETRYDRARANRSNKKRS